MEDDRSVADLKKHQSHPKMGLEVGSRKRENLGLTSEEARSHRIIEKRMPAMTADHCRIIIQ